MIENTIIFSKDSKSTILTSTYGEVDPKEDNFTESLEKIREIAVQLEKGVFNLALDGNLTAMILAIPKLSIAIIFNEEADKQTIRNWEKVAKEVITNFDKVYESRDMSRILTFKDTMDEIINWHINEQSPIDKMKDALW